MKKLEIFTHPIFGITLYNFITNRASSDSQLKPKPFFESYYKKSEDHSFSWKSLGYDFASCIVPVILLPLLIPSAILRACFFMLLNFSTNFVMIFTNLFHAKFQEAGISLLTAIFYPIFFAIGAALLLPLFTVMVALMKLMHVI